MTRTSSTLVAALTLSLIGGAAFAQSSRNVPPTWANEQTPTFVSTVTRAQVLAELQAARQSGDLNTFDNLAYMQPKAVGAPASPVLAQVHEGAQRVAATARSQSTDGALTREQVRAELDAARNSGELNPFDNLAYRQGDTAARVVAPAALARAK